MRRRSRRATTPMPDPMTVVQLRITGTRVMIDDLLKDMQFTRYAFGRISDFYEHDGGQWAVYVHMHKMKGESE